MELFDSVIGDITESTAEERRDAGYCDWPAAFQKLFERFQRGFGSEACFFAIFDDFDLSAAGFEDPVGPRSQKGVTCPAFTSFHAFKQKRIVVTFESFEERKRSLQIHKQLLIHGNQVALVGEPAKLFKARLNHFFYKHKGP